jgi:hypothetical protein
MTSDDHSASRNLEALREEAPHLIAEPADVDALEWLRRRTRSSPASLASCSRGLALAGGASVRSSAGTSTARGRRSSRLAYSSRGRRERWSRQVVGTV